MVAVHKFCVFLIKEQYMYFLHNAGAKIHLITNNN